MIGIDVSDRSVKIVRLDESSHKLLAHCWQPVPESVMVGGEVKNGETLLAVIKKALETCEVNLTANDAVVASIPETQSFLRVIEVPIMRDDEVGEAVQWEVAQHIPFGLENVYIDWQPLLGGHKAASGQQEILVGAAQKKVIDPYFQVLRGLGMDIAALELESQALTRALVSKELLDKEGVLIVDLGGSATNVVIHDHATIRFTASLQKGAQHVRSVLSNKDGQKIERLTNEVMDQVEQEQLAERLRPALDEIVMEIRGIVEFYNSIDVQHEVREIILTGGGANMPGLGDAFLRHFDSVHVQRGNPWVNIVSGRDSAKLPVDLQESVRFSTAIGLALREVIY